MLLLLSSKLMLGGGAGRKRNGGSFPHPLLGPLPELQSPSEAETGMLTQHAPRPAPSTWPERRCPPGTVPSHQPWGWAELGGEGRSGSCWPRRGGCTSKVSSEQSNEPTP